MYPGAIANSLRAADMLSRPRAFRIAFRALFAATGLLLTLVVAIQFFARTSVPLNSVTKVKAQQAAKPKRSSVPNDPPDITVPAGSDMTSPFSGSVANDPDFFAVAPPSIEAAVKIDIDPNAGAVPLPPIDDVNEDSSCDVPFELRSIEQRLSELERRSAPDRAACAQDASTHSTQFAGVLAQLHGQSQEIKSTLQRIERIEKRTASTPEESIPGQRISIRPVEKGGESRWMIQARDASLPELLARLGEATGMNLVVSSEIAGNVSLHLSELDAESALDAVCKIHHCRAAHNGNFVVISRDTVADHGGRPSLPETISKLYRLRHLSGAEIRPYIQPLLTPGLGTCGFAIIRERVARMTYRHPPRAILVKDTARVIAEVDRLIGELDRPPADGLELPPSDKPVPERVPAGSTAAETSRLSELFDLPTTSDSPIRSRE